MRYNKVTVPIAALAFALVSLPAEAQRGGGSRGGGERGERRNSQSQPQGRDNPRQGASAQPRERQVDRGGQAQGRARQSASAQPRDRQVDRGGGPAARGGQRNQGVVDRNPRGIGRDSRDFRRNEGFSARRGNDRGGFLDRRDSYRYSAPRALPRRLASRNYYRPSRGLSLYFGLGSGYRYGSLYDGRVYGYRGPAPVYGAYRYYGDVRLLVRPRDAEVYVDGYYTGLVDDFDGIFQRLTLEVGAHQIEIVAPGLESQVFDVYVDPSRTIDVHADLLPLNR